MSSTDHQLTDIRVGDDPDAWAAIGFTVMDGSLVIANTAVTLTGSHDDRGITSVAVDGLGAVVDGITTHAPPAPRRAVSHANAVSSIDHLVVMTPDCDRTTDELESAGIEARRVRTFEAGGTVRRQTFFWLGDVILEMVGVDADHGPGPASLWGLALSSDDLDATIASLGGLCTPPKPAVQRGRQITTIKTRDVDITTAIAVLSPHPG